MRTVRMAREGVSLTYRYDPADSRRLSIVRSRDDVEHRFEVQGEKDAMQVLDSAIEMRRRTGWRIEQDGTDQKIYTPPDWMLPYLGLLGGRTRVVRLMSGDRARIETEAQLAMAQCQMSGTVAVLCRLHEAGLLVSGAP